MRLKLKICESQHTNPVDDVFQRRVLEIHCGFIHASIVPCIVSASITRKISIDSFSTFFRD
jgi:hypothetical protein